MNPGTVTNQTTQPTPDHPSYTPFTSAFQLPPCPLTHTYTHTHRFAPNITFNCYLANVAHLYLNSTKLVLPSCSPNVSAFWEYLIAHGTGNIQSLIFDQIHICSLFPRVSRCIWHVSQLVVGCVLWKLVWSFLQKQWGSIGGCVFKESVGWWEWCKHSVSRCTQPVCCFIWYVILCMHCLQLDVILW